MADSSTTATTDTTFQTLLQSVTQLATPFVQSLALGRQGATDAQLQANANKYNQLNGSGANNPALASSQSPKGIFDFLFGGGNTQTTPTPSGVSSYAGLVVVGLVVLVAFLMMRR